MKHSLAGLAVVSALLLSACGESTAGTTDASGANGTTSTSISTTGFLPDGPTSVTFPNSLGGDTGVPVSWVTATLADDGMSITVTWMGSDAACFPATKLDVDVQGASAKLDLYVSDVGIPESRCPDEGTENTVTANLTGPLPDGTQFVDGTKAVQAP